MTTCTGPRRWLATLALLTLVFAAGCASRGAAPNARTDPEAATPAAPEPAPPQVGSALIEFEVRPGSRVRYLVERDSLRTHDVELRFTLVVIGSGGARNVTRQAIDCAKPAQRLLAVASADGARWRAVNQDWQVLGTTRRDRRELQIVHDAGCIGRAPARTHDEIVERLQQLEGAGLVD
ncbi:MAG: CNP1-like family protein [Burkholderiaceae bacterium]